MSKRADAITTPSSSEGPNRTVDHQLAATGTVTAAATTTVRSPRARRTRKHSGRSNGGSATPSTPACWPTPARPPQRPRRAREGNRGTTLSPARLAHTPGTSSSDKPLPGPKSAYGPPTGASLPCLRNRGQRRPSEALDSKEDSIWVAAGRQDGHPGLTRTALSVLHGMAGRLPR